VCWLDLETSKADKAAGCRTNGCDRCCIDTRAPGKSRHAIRIDEIYPALPRSVLLIRSSRCCRRMRDELRVVSGMSSSRLQKKMTQNRWPAVFISAGRKKLALVSLTKSGTKTLIQWK